MVVLRLAIFLVVLYGVSAGIHYYLWKGLHHKLSWPEPFDTWGTRFFQTMALLVPTSLWLMRLLPPFAKGFLAWISFTWMGFVFYLFLFTLLRAPALALYRRWRAPDQAVPHSRERRLFLARASAGIASALAGLVGLGGMLQLYRPLKVHTIPITLSRLRRDLPVFRIAQITDVHVGPMVERADIQKIVALINGVRPDIVAITGDLVDGSVSELRDVVDPLRSLDPRYGTFFVTGNHEYYTETDEWLDHLSRMNIRVLGNERVTIFHEGQAIDIAGVHDWTAHYSHPTHRHDLRQALMGRPLSRPVILLAHQPRSFVEAQRYNVDLQISGHTHGGQIKPFNWLTRLVQPYVEGWHQRNHSQLYVSPGTGFWGPPMRVGTRSEVTLLEVRGTAV